MHKKGLQTKYEAGKTGDFLGLMIWLHCVDKKDGKKKRRCTGEGLRRIT